MKKENYIEDVLRSTVMVAQILLLIEYLQNHKRILKKNMQNFIACILYIREKIR